MRVHLKSYISNWSGLSWRLKAKFAYFTRCRIRSRKPFLKARAMSHCQRTGTFTEGEKRFLTITFMANPANGFWGTARTTVKMHTIFHAKQQIVGNIKHKNGPHNNELEAQDHSFKVRPTRCCRFDNNLYLFIRISTRPNPADQRLTTGWTRNRIHSRRLDYQPEGSRRHFYYLLHLRNHVLWNVPLKEVIKFISS